jgi:hypothetical protein
VFILPKAPTPRAEIHELADFAELLCLEKDQTSAREIVAYLGRVDDNEHNDGCDDDADEAAELLDDVMNEVDRRAHACPTGYPFRLDRKGTVLRFELTEDQQKSSIYIYLLLSTRLNMKDKRVHDNIDGTHLLEELGAHVLRNYLGGSKAKTLVMGTSIGGTFEKRVQALCERLCEGTGFRNLDDAPVKAQDDKLDAVAWVPFRDSLPGQLIIFGQCKTGSNWENLVHQLQPDAFVKKWMQDPILVNPIRAFCISEAANRATWKGTNVGAGILLDRCRLVDFSDNADADLMQRMNRWIEAARKSIVVPKEEPRNVKRKRDDSSPLLDAD